ncbi:MAG: hypothetical protein Kow0069_14900 [Promethearchaeota archaeon]
MTSRRSRKGELKGNVDQDDPGRLVGVLLESEDPKRQFSGLQRFVLPEQAALQPRVVELAVRGDSPDVKQLAKKRLAYFRQAAVDLLAGYLASSNRDERVRAAQLMGSLREPAAVDHLLAHGSKTLDSVELAAVTLSLGMIGDERALTFLVEASKSRDPKVRAQAATALGNFKNGAGRDALLALISDAREKEKVKFCALVALERLVDPSIEPAVRRVLHDPGLGPKVANQAKRLLHKCREWVRDAPLIAKRREEEAEIFSLAGDVEPLFAALRDDVGDPEPLTSVLPLDEYAKLLRKGSLSQFRVEFQRYFRKVGEPVLSFDTELFCGYPVLYMGVVLRGPNDLEAFGAVVPSLRGIRHTSRALQRHLLDELRGRRLLVTAHGLNRVEQNALLQAGVRFFDTGRIVKLMKRTDKENFRAMASHGLGKFEKAVHFKRLACHFWKHKISEKALQAQMVEALRRGLAGQPYRTCKICEKPQDHFLYCLEDAFSSVLIYAYVRNRFDVKPRGSRAGSERSGRRARSPNGRGTGGRAGTGGGVTAGRSAAGRERRRER